MKFLYLIPIVFLLSLYSCSTEFDVTAKWKDVTIVYGLLNKADSVQYIKINKAFLDPETSALEIAKRSDSLFYDSITVTMKRLKDGVIDTLQRVDGNKIGLVKEGGEGAIFANDPNYLYVYTRKLREDSQYELRVAKLNGETITAITDVANSVKELITPLAIDSASHAACDKTGHHQTVLGAEGSEIKIRWDAVANSKFYEMYLRFHYEENYDGDKVCQYLDYKLFSDKVCVGCSKGEELKHTVEIDNVLSFLRAKIPVDPSVIRTMQCFDFILKSGSQELRRYVTINEAQLASIVQTQAVVEYSNIDGGKGLFASRFDSTYYNFKFAQYFLTELATSENTAALNFEDSDRCNCNIFKGGGRKEDYHDCPGSN